MTGRYRVLHVDDDPGVLEVSRRLLSREEHLVTVTTTDPTEGLELLESGAVDCLVSDSIALPDGEPFVVAARERATDVPIVLFTAQPWEDVAEAAMAAGVDEYVRKGINRGESAPLYDRVRSLAAETPAEFDDADVTERRETVTDRECQDGRDDDWQPIGRHDWETYHELGSSIVLALEAFTGEPIAESDPLFETIDTDALEALLHPDRSVSDGLVSVRFRYQGYDLAVRSDGSIAARASTEDELRT